MSELDTLRAKVAEIQAQLAVSETVDPASASKFIVMCDWDQVPHLSESQKARLLAEIPPSHRAARRAGVPMIGAGKIYPLLESDIKVPDFPIPPHWKRGFGMDAGGGAKPTAAVWGALDPVAQVLYLDSVYKREAAEPVIHAEAIKARGAWIPGVGDCAALIVTRHDAEQLIAVYKGLGLDLELPDKSVETGIQEVWELLSTGRMKVFASCTKWFEEFRLYSRNDKGAIVKKNDHLMDATRYLVRSGRERMKARPVPAAYDSSALASGPSGWMAS